MIKLDPIFVNEVNKAANGDGSRAYMFDLIKELREVSQALGNRYRFNDCIKGYGRAKVGICVAATILYNSYRHEAPQIAWAQAVMALWSNRIGRSVNAATINIHPAILSDNSHYLREVTTIQ